MFYARVSEKAAYIPLVELIRPRIGTYCVSDSVPDRKGV